MKFVPAYKPYFRALYAGDVDEHAHDYIFKLMFYRQKSCLLKHAQVQGDLSRWTKPFLDMKSCVLVYDPYTKTQLKFYVNGRFGPT